MKRRILFCHFSRIWRCLLLGLALVSASPLAFAASLTEIPGPVGEAAVRLVRYCDDPKAGLDEQAVATLVDYVLSSKNSNEHSLPESNRCSGAYYEFDTKIAFPRFLNYSYSSLVPPNITRPSSLRCSIWSNPRSDMQKMPGDWTTIPPHGVPLVIRGLQHESITPDLNTGAYYEYDLKRVLILLNHKGRQALVSVSKQIDKSSVGKKGVILGNDKDWSYFYSNEPGTMKTGLGWAKSYIYDFFSVLVYTESPGSPTTVRSGAFQWLRAGWSGINLVRPGHILNGMRQRFAQASKMILESPQLPAPSQLSSVYQSLSDMQTSALANEYEALQQAQRSSAIQAGKIGKSEGDAKKPLVDTPKEQMVQELMLEYLKMALGKPTPLKRRPSLFTPVQFPQDP